MRKKVVLLVAGKVGEPAPKLIIFTAILGQVYAARKKKCSTQLIQKNYCVYFIVLKHNSKGM